MAIEVEIAKIRKEPQVRQNIDMETIKGLASSISRVGQLHPIIVKPDGDGYVLVAGERRLEAMKYLGRETIQAVVWEGNASPREVQLIENVQREDVDPVSKAKAIAELMNSEGLTKKDVATRLGLPRTTVTDWLDVLEIKKKYQDLVVDNFKGGQSSITPSHVSIALAVAAKRQKPSLAYQLLDAVDKHTLSRAQTQAVATFLGDSPDMTVRRAVALVLVGIRKKKGGNGEAKAGGVNVPMLMAALARWRGQLERTHGVGAQEMTEQTRKGLVEQLTELRKRVEALLEELRV